MEKAYFKGRGGLRIGDFDDYAGLNIGWPLAAIEITENTITLKYSRRLTFQFTKESVDNIGHYKGILSRGIQIFHHKESEKAFIVFGTYKASKILNVLRENGWPVKTEKKPKDDKDGMWLKP